MSQTSDLDGEFMTDSQIETYINDSLGVLKVMSEQSSPRYKQLKDSLLIDLEYLHSTGRLEEDEYNELIELLHANF